MKFNTTSEVLQKLVADNKKVTMELIGVNGNAFGIMGAFQKFAQRQKWSKEEINAVFDEMQSDDYNHLLSVAIEFTQSEEEEEDNDDGWRDDSWRQDSDEESDNRDY